MTAITADFIQFGRRLFPLLHPTAADIDVAAGAEALARIARFTGHTIGEPYSVAQHCVLVSCIVERLTANWRCAATRHRAVVWGMLHDWHEAVLGDISSPVKRLLRRDTDIIDRAATAIDIALAGAVGMVWPLEAAVVAIVHQADMTALATEKRDLLEDAPDWGYQLPAALETHIAPVSWQMARQMWLQRYAALAITSPMVTRDAATA